MQYNFPKKISHVMRLTAFRGRRSTTQWQMNCGTCQGCVCTSFPTTSSSPTYQRNTCMPPTNMGGSSHYGRPPLWCTQSWFHGSACISLTPEVCFADCIANWKWHHTLGNPQLVTEIVGMLWRWLVPTDEILECIRLPNSKSTAITQVAWTWLSWNIYTAEMGRPCKSGLCHSLRASC